MADVLANYRPGAAFDEMVDGGWPRALLLPRWALAGAVTPTGRACLNAAGRFVPSPA